MKDDKDDLMRMIGRIWRSCPTLSFGQLMANVGNDAGMSVDNMSDAQIYAVLSNFDHNGMWGT